MRAEPWAGSQETKAFTWSHGRVVGGGGLQVYPDCTNAADVYKSFFQKVGEGQPQGFSPTLLWAGCSLCRRERGRASLVNRYGQWSPLPS